MKLQKLITLICFTFLIAFSSNGQNKKYIGDWLLTSGPFRNKCAKDQSIVLRKDGTATYHYGQNTEGCKGKTQNYKKWKVETRKFKKRKKNMLGEKKTVIIKKTALVIGEDDMVFYIEKKRGKTMKVATDVVSGDTTKGALISLKKRKMKK